MIVKNVMQQSQEARGTARKQQRTQKPQKPEKAKEQQKPRLRSQAVDKSHAKKKNILVVPTP